MAENNEIKALLHINKEDIYEYNLYVLKTQKHIGNIIPSLIFIILGIIGLITDEKTKKAIILNIVLILIGIVGYFLLKFIPILLLKQKLKKRITDDLPPVEIKLSDDGILYQYEKENQSSEKPISPFLWQEVSKVVITNHILYIHFTSRIFLVVTMKDIDPDLFISYLKTKVADKIKDKRKIKQ